MRIYYTGKTLNPFLFQEGECHYNKTNVGAKDTGFVDVEQGNEQALKEAVGKAYRTNKIVGRSLHRTVFGFVLENTWEGPDIQDSRVKYFFLALRVRYAVKGSQSTNLWEIKQLNIYI